MTSPKWCLFMGGLSTCLNLCTVLYYFTGLIGLHNLGVEDGEKEPNVIDAHDSNETNVDDDLQHFSRDQIAEYTFELVIRICLLVASVLLIVGVKKQMHKLLAPWIYMVLLSAIGFLLDFFFDSDSDEEKIVRFIATFILFAMWYPVYKHYKFLRNKSSQAAPVENCSPQGNVYPCAPNAVYAATTEFMHTGQQYTTAPTHV